MAKDKHQPTKKQKRDEIKPGGFRIEKAKASALPKSYLLFGRPKAGKSSLGASIAGVYENVLWLDIDDGAGGFANEYPNIDVVNFRRGDVNGLEKFWRELVKDDGRDYDAIGFDTLSIAQKWKFNTLSPGYERYNEVDKWASDIMWDLHSMSPVGIACLHVEMANTVRGSGGDEFVQLTPSLEGKKSKMSLPAIPDVIGFLEVVEEDEGFERIIRFWSEEAVSGNRFRALPAALYNPTMPRIYEILRNGGVD